MADLGRWGNIDPLAEQYTNLSPYAFVANMPTIAIDPDGKRIIVIGGKNYKKRMYSGMLEMASTKAGFDLLSKLSGDDKNDVIVSQYTKNGKVLRKNGYLGGFTRKGSSKTNHYINISLTDNGDLNGGIPKNLATSLTHEFGHAADKIDGVNQDHSAVVAEGSDNFARADEVANVHRENLVRAGLGMKLRDNYGLVPVMNMRVTNQWTTFGLDDDDAKKLVPKAEGNHFDYSKVPKASINSMINALHFMFNNHSRTNNLNSFKSSRYKFNSSIKSADVLSK